MLSGLPNYSTNRQANKDDTPTHRLVVLLLKGAWTPRNRDIIFALYDSFRKTQVCIWSVVGFRDFGNVLGIIWPRFCVQQLKKNLSTAALKGFRCPDSSTTPIKTRSRSIESQVPPGSPIQVIFTNERHISGSIGDRSSRVEILFLREKTKNQEHMFQQLIIFAESVIFFSSLKCVVVSI